MSKYNYLLSYRATLFQHLQHLCVYAHFLGAISIF